MRPCKIHQKWFHANNGNFFKLSFERRDVDSDSAARISISHSSPKKAYHLWLARVSVTGLCKKWSAHQAFAEHVFSISQRFSNCKKWGANDWDGRLFNPLSVLTLEIDAESEVWGQPRAADNGKIRVCWGKDMFDLRNKLGFCDILLFGLTATSLVICGIIRWQS